MVQAAVIFPKQQRDGQKPLPGPSSYSVPGGEESLLFSCLFKITNYDSLLAFIGFKDLDGSVRDILRSALTLMATVTIPSPSAFLTSPVLEAPPAPQVSIKANSKKRVSATSKARKASALADNATAKPKQTKSRDGMYSCSTVSLSWFRCRRCNKR